MFGNIGKDFVELTSRKFARIVAYAIGLTAILLLCGQVLYVFNQVLDAVEGASPRATVQGLALTAALTTVVLYICKHLIARWGRRAVLEVEEAGAAAMESTTALQDQVSEYMEAATRAWNEVEEAGARADAKQERATELLEQVRERAVIVRTALQRLREKGLLDDKEESLDDTWPDAKDGS